jgi:hypothetical protein
MHIINLNVERWSLIESDRDSTIEPTLENVLDMDNDISCSTILNEYDLDRVCFGREYVH